MPYWKLVAPKAGRYKVEITYSSRRANADYSVEIGAAKLMGKTVSTGNEWVFKTQTLGQVELGAGASEVRVKPVLAGGAAAMSLEKIVLTPVR